LHAGIGLAGTARDAAFGFDTTTGDHLKRGWDQVESPSRFRLLFAHDPSGLRHAEGASAPQAGQARGHAFSENRFALVRIMR
jgi:hypothetical protein